MSKQAGRVGETWGAGVNAGVKKSEGLDHLPTPHSHYKFKFNHSQSFLLLVNSRQDKSPSLQFPVTGAHKTQLENIHTTEDVRVSIPEQKGAATFRPLGADHGGLQPSLSLSGGLQGFEIERSGPEVRSDNPFLFRVNNPRSHFCLLLEALSDATATWSEKQQLTLDARRGLPTALRPQRQCP